MGRAWDDLELDGAEGRYTAAISPAWELVVVPQGGVVAAIAVRAMERLLADPGQTLRTMTALFAGQVAGGPVEIDVQLLRRGRSMSQLTATVRNPGVGAGLTAIAAFGAPRKGFDFTELTMPDVASPDALRGFRDPLPEGIEFGFDERPRPFWDEIVEGRPAIGRPPWEEFVGGPAEAASWYRIDDPPRRADGTLDPAGVVVLCDTMPSSVGQKLGPATGPWFAPSVDYTLHLFQPARSEWLLTHQKARYAGDGYASVECALWDPADGEPTLVAYATQIMVFSFPR